MFIIDKSIVLVLLACLIYCAPGLLKADANYFDSTISTIGFKQSDENIFVIVEVAKNSLKSLQENRLFANMTMPPQQVPCEVNHAFTSVGFEPPISKTDTTMILVTCVKTQTSLTNHNFRQSYFIEVLQKPDENAQNCHSRMRHRNTCQQKSQQVTRILSGHY